MKKEALGVDIGNVVINHRLMDKSNSDDWKKEYLSSPPLEDVFESLDALNNGKFKDATFLVSKCKEEAEFLIKVWLDKHDFYNKTGIAKDKVFFCRERSDKDKICQENNIKYFIDDRLEVLGYMVGNVPNLYLFQPEEKEVEEFKQFLSKVTLVSGWLDLMRKIGV